MPLNTRFYVSDKIPAFKITIYLLDEIRFYCCRTLHTPRNTRVVGPPYAVKKKKIIMKMVDRSSRYYTYLGNIMRRITCTRF